MIVAVLPLQERIFRLQLQFFSLCFVGINYCNVTPFLYRILSFQNIICNNFVPNGSAIGDTISRDAPYSAIGFRGDSFFCLSLDCDRPFLRKEVGV